MADIITLRAEARDRAGKGAARATRRSGRVPGVIYGDKEPPVLISVEPRELVRELRKPGFFARLLNVEIDGKQHRTLPRDVQLHPVNDLPVHVDFMRVHAGTRITVAVPVVFENQEKSPGLRRGGLLNIVRHEIELICAAESIPDRITINLEGLDIGDSIHIGAVALPEGTRPAIGDRNFTVASIAAPTAVRDEQAAAAAAAAAPAAETPATPAPGTAPATPATGS